MRRGLDIAWCAGLMAISATLAAQSPAPARSRAQSILSFGSPASVSNTVLGTQAQGFAPGELVPGEIVREIDDPHNGDRWLLVRNAETPSGPGRLVRIAAHSNESGGTAGLAAHAPEETVQLPVIHAGDRLTVEEHTARVDATLEARALAPAAVGGSLDVRLTIGGRVARVVALGAGHAAFQTETGARP
jgi:hypothetical protein